MQAHPKAMTKEKERKFRWNGNFLEHASSMYGIMILYSNFKSFLAAVCYLSSGNHKKTTILPN